MRHGLIALSPIAVFLLTYLGGSILAGDFYHIPVGVAFLLTCIYAIAVLRPGTLKERVDVFSHGAGQPNVMMMLWIFLLAGAFAASAKAMGAVDATVQLAMQCLPDRLILAGLFLAACFISLSIGTSVGTIVALTPIAAGVAESAGMDTAMIVGIVVGGAFFGDNLSFISDTTIMATRTQGCRMSDKFRVNLRVVTPAAVGCLLLYVVMGTQLHTAVTSTPIDALKVLPYIVVLVTALAGVEVLVVLTVGVILSGIVGMAYGGYDLLGWMKAMGEGMMGISELVIVSMLAGGLMELIKHAGGIDFFIRRTTRMIKGRRGAEFTIATLVAFTNVCTANNTVAILTVGPIARQIALRFGIDPRRSASLLDTFSCLAQSLLPYGAQLLMAAGLAAISPVEIIPYLYYPFAMGCCAMLSIAFKRKAHL
ncbi:MAG: Na+/H+ antiporter NhaC family protein [Bacteroidaceae bacterium]|nr:Na+/H+ antiporter NhaC family protein [Bacteroidaceae bacterium]